MNPFGPLTTLGRIAWAIICLIACAFAIARYILEYHQ